MTDHPPTRNHRVSFLMLTYNQAALVRDSALACLAQECEPMDIVFSDDASSDDTYAVLQDIAKGYRGPHRVIVRRNSQNLGIGGHVNTLIADSDSALFIASAGDDISLPHRARQLIKAWDNSDQRADLITSHCFRMHFDGTLAEEIHTHPLETVTPAQWVQSRPYIVGATHAFTRRLHERFGAFIPGVGREDQIMTFRAVCEGTCLTVDEALVYYRDGGISRSIDLMSGSELRAWTQKNNRLDIAEMRQVMADARQAGLIDLAEGPIQDKLNRALFLDDVLQHDHLRPMLARCSSHPSLPAWWRYKKAFAMAFHDQYSAFQRHNRARRQFMRRLRGR